MKEKVFKFLDELRRSGETNMFGATPYIMEEFPELNQDEAVKYLKDWMETFNERHQCIFEKRFCEYANKNGNSFNCTAPTDEDMTCWKK